MNAAIDPVDAPLNYCFKANWCGQVIALTTERSRPAHEIRSRLASAIVLGELDPVCQKIESIICCSLDFRPHSSTSLATDVVPEYACPPGIVLKLQCADDTPVSVNLPSAAWPHLSQHSALEFSETVLWTSVTAVVCVARFQLGVDDTARLALGSLVLLPESFDKSWQMSIEVADIAHRHEVLFERETRTLTPVFRRAVQTPVKHANVCPDKSATRNNQTLVEVHLQEPLALDPSLLLERTGMPEWSSTDLPRLPPLHRSLCTVSINGSPQYEGNLVAAGEGHGLYLSARSVW